MTHDILADFMFFIDWQYSSQLKIKFNLLLPAYVSSLISLSWCYTLAAILGEGETQELLRSLSEFGGHSLSIRPFLPDHCTLMSGNLAYGAYHRNRLEVGQFKHRSEN